MKLNKPDQADSDFAPAGHKRPESAQHRTSALRVPRQSAGALYPRAAGTLAAEEATPTYHVVGTPQTQTTWG